SSCDCLFCATTRPGSATPFPYTTLFRSQIRGDLVSRPIANVLYEAERLVAAGVKEILVISQDTSAYGLDIKYATSRLRGRDIPRSEEHTSELQSRENLVCRLLLEKKKKD